MTKGVLIHRQDSIYDDLPEVQYQFPKQYLGRAQELLRDWIVYYEPRRGGGRSGYFAIARISKIEPDPIKENMFVAGIEPGSYCPFEQFVPHKHNDRHLETEMNPGRQVWAIRSISDPDFAKIIELGFPEQSGVLPRTDQTLSSHQIDGLSEEQMEYELEPAVFRVEETVTRIVRERAFRRNVLEAYDSTCALTGLRFLNGGGRAEAEAAHIQPVAAGGPDSVRNGLALSGTVHWMFDRGLVSIGSENQIMVSRQVNNPDEVWRLMNPSRQITVPAHRAYHPHPRYLNWHRENCFKN